MLSTITQMYVDFLEFSKNNPVLAGVAALWVAGVSTFFLKILPGRILNFIKGQCVTSLTLNNQAYSGNASNFIAFNEWFFASKWVKFSRSLSVNAKSWSGDRLAFGAGYGYHMFFFQGRFYWFYKEKVESQGDAFKEIIVIYTFGRSNLVFQSLVDEFRIKPNADEIAVSEYVKDHWENISPIKRRPIESIILDHEVKSKILHDLDAFFKQKNWYYERHLPYKKAIILHGPPGTGKTSLIRSLASYFNKNLYIGQLEGFTDSSLKKAMQEVQPGSFVVFEDISDTAAIRKKKLSHKYESITDAALLEHGIKPENHDVETPQTLSDLFSEHGLLTTSGVLNIFDGIVPLDDIVIFLTTNYLEAIDPVFLRKGRIDQIVYIGHLTHPEICDYLRYMFKVDHISVDGVFKPIAGCDLQALFYDHCNDISAMIKNIPLLTQEHSHEAVQ